VAATRFSLAGAQARLEAVVRFLRTGEWSPFFRWLVPSSYRDEEVVLRGVG